MTGFVAERAVRASTLSMRMMSISAMPTAPKFRCPTSLLPILPLGQADVGPARSDEAVRIALRRAHRGWASSRAGWRSRLSPRARRSRRGWIEDDGPRSVRRGGHFDGGKTTASRPFAPSFEVCASDRLATWRALAPRRFSEDSKVLARVKAGRRPSRLDEWPRRDPVQVDGSKARVPRPPTGISNGSRARRSDAGRRRASPGEAAPSKTRAPSSTKEERSAARRRMPRRRRSRRCGAGRTRGRSTPTARARAIPGRPGLGIVLLRSPDGQEYGSRLRVPRRPRRTTSPSSPRSCAPQRSSPSAQTAIVHTD